MKRHVAFVLFGMSGVMARALRGVGYHAVYCFDLLNDGRTEDGVHFIQADLDTVDFREYPRPEFAMSFAPCTDLAGSGARWWKRKAKKDPDFQIKAMRRAQLVSHLGCRWMLENPVGALSRLWRKPDLIINPCDFGGYLPEEDEGMGIFPARDAYNKKTCLWTGNGAQLPQTDPVPPLGHRSPVMRLGGGGGQATRIARSVTPRGMAAAIAQANPPLSA